MPQSKEEIVLETKRKVSGWVALILAVINTIVAYGLFVSDWWMLFQTEVAAGRPDEGEIVRWILPGLNDLIMLGGVIWLVAAYGFFTRTKWASTAGVIAAVTSLVGAYFWMVPPMSRGLFPSYLAVFLANVVGYVVMVRYTRGVAPWVAALSLLAGITYVLTFMNGIASTDKIILTGKALYVGAQRLNWVGGAAWAAAVVGLVHLKPWARLVGIGAGALSVLGGAPLAYVTMVDAGKFSMFAPAPLMGLLLGILFALPAFARRYDQLCVDAGGAVTPSA